MKIFLAVIFFTAGLLPVHSQNNRIEHYGKQLFLNGSNLAWINFASDIGPGATNFEAFGQVFRDNHSYGVNAIRLWLHTNGTVTPEFSGNMVVGPGAGAIEDLKQILDSAYKYDIGLILCLWSFDMLRLEIGQPYLTRNRALIEVDSVLESYIDKALIPMVDSTKDHPAILSWEVFNEPEGMVEGIPWGGWSDIGHVTMANVQKVVNRVAGAIHRVKPELKVTNGTHTFYSLSDRGVQNFYSDSALFNEGGDAEGYLDFYQVHFYDFPLNPFEHEYSYWNLDKPLIIGELHPGCATCGGFSNYETLYELGYAGALGWMWLDTWGDSIKKEVEYMFVNHTADVDIDSMIGDFPILYVTGPAYGEVLEAGADVVFSAEATDTDGEIVKVEYFLEKEFAEDSLLATLSAVPYNYTMEEPGDGLYRVYVMATDNDGYTKTSSLMYFIVGDPPVYRYEAEHAVFTGDITVANNASASNGKYLSCQQNGSIRWTILNVPADGEYNMHIGYSSPSGDKNNYVMINNDTLGRYDVQFLQTSQWSQKTLAVNLKEGTNSVEVTLFWGWMNFDYLEFPFPRPPFVSQIFVTSSTGLDFIDEPEGTLQMQAEILPENAGIQEVEWRVTGNNAFATIDQNGLLRAVKNGTVGVIARATDNSGVEGRMNITITNQPTDIRTLNENIVLFYPNPAADRLYFSTEEGITSARICNLQGELLRYENLNSGRNIMDVSDLPKGLYMLTIYKISGDVINGLVRIE